MSENLDDQRANTRHRLSSLTFVPNCSE
jgi:hypothetical protein